MQAVDEYADPSWWQEQVSRLQSLVKEDSILGPLAFEEVTAGGKHVRARIPIACVPSPTKTQSFADYREAALWLGIAVELVHAGTLCHDDVMDGDSMRRGRPSAWRRLGRSQALTLGDYLFYLADEALHRAPLPADRCVWALRTLSRSARQLAEGQALENQLRLQAILPTKEQYLKIAQGKSGALFEVAINLGLHCMQSNAPPYDHSTGLGLELGSSYQILDDLIDLIGDKGREKAGCDLWEGKPSWLVVRCAETLNSTGQQRLRELVYKPRESKTLEDVTELREMFIQSGALAVACKDVSSLLDALRRRLCLIQTRLAAALDQLITKMELSFQPYTSSPLLAYG